MAYIRSKKLKHIALRSKSIRSGDRPYTTPGLGDRIQSVLLAYQYGKKHNTPVTLHLTDDKWSVAGGVPSNKKKISWKEIISLFPKNTVQVQPWPVENLPEDEWLKYLKQKRIDAEIYYYKDTMHMHPNETVVPLEMSQYLKEPIMLEPTVNAWLPDKFITVQWDSTDAGRTLSSITREKIHSKYEGTVIYVGGEGTGHFKDSLAHIGAAMVKAEYHVGSDSGMMHLAQLYKRFEDIHIYSPVNGYTSHHLIRAINNGTKHTRI